MSAFLADPDVSLVFWTLVKIFVILNGLLGVVSYLILAERKLAGRMQGRFGPNRVGPLGLLQPIADVVKLFFKEEVIPAEANKAIFHHRPDAGGDSGADHLLGDPDRAQLHRHRHQRGPPAVPRDVESRRLRHHPGGLVLEQQVRAARGPALFGPDDLLRARDGALHRRRAAHGGFALDGGHRQRPAADLVRPLPAARFPDLHDHRARGDQPRRRSICRRPRPSWWRDSTPSTRA